jgi:hypothetical protein
MVDKTEADYASMSDDEFMNQAFSGDLPPLPEGVGAGQEVVTGPVMVEAPIEVSSTAGSVAPAEAAEEDLDDAAVLTQAAAAAVVPAAPSLDPGHTTPKQTEAPQDALETAPEAKTEQSFEELYKKIMAPFKANGRDFTPESPEEAVKLMQLGANYTKKMHKLAPNLKLMRMLENNGLLDEGKLNYLIDLNKKEPGAVHRLLSEAKIDPLDIDPEKPVAYTPGNHQVSDNEMAFHDAITAVSESSTGKETIRHVNDTWDAQSKQELYRDPQILEVINEQRANGIYAKISAEIDRQKILGNLANVPFIQAYHQVGGYLNKQGLLGNQSSAPVNPGPARVLETRIDPVRTQMPNGDKARAASPAPKSAPSQAKVLDPFSPFTMTDSEIMALTTQRI